jgi:hypothetical protein
MYGSRDSPLAVYKLIARELRNLHHRGVPQKTAELYRIADGFTGNGNYSDRSSLLVYHANGRFVGDYT